MGLFGEQSKEDKQEKQLQNFMDKYQLKDLDEKYLVILKRITNDLYHNQTIAFIKYRG
ncbi:hypothetical protein GOM49_13265 [Clostridium bovifaecis]|uniref:Uncharacterized protein n=1 Tax=Clostridium bovifaecis TaxID=2184719 RepID=A0A6I6F093_9CLOT|nr:hypothetical protein GOM49_13265 [Clostridium bovifaecis]